MRVGDAGVAIALAAHARDDTDIGYRLGGVAGAAQDLAVLERGILGQRRRDDVIVVETSDLQGAWAVCRPLAIPRSGPRHAQAQRAGPPC